MKIKIFAGQEKPDFWEAIGGQEEYAHDKRLADPSNILPARLFQCSNATGVFKGMSWFLKTTPRSLSQLLHNFVNFLWMLYIITHMFKQ